MNAWCFTVWRANITRNVLGKSSKHLDCGSIAGVVLLVCLFMHSPLWRHDVGFLSQTSLFVTETFHAEWQSRSQGFSSYVATTPRQQLSPQMSNVFFSFSFVRKTTWSSAHFNHISIIFTCDWSKVYFSTVLFWTSYWFFLLFRRKINCYRNSPSRAINYFCIGSILLEHTKRTVGRQLYTTTQRIFLAQSGSSINIAVWKWLCKTLSLSGAPQACSALLFGAVVFLVLLTLLLSPALPDVTITNILEKKNVTCVLLTFFMSSYFNNNTFGSSLCFHQLNTWSNQEP